MCRRRTRVSVAPQADGRSDELRLFESQDLTAHHARDTCPRGDGQGNEETAEPATQDGHECDEQQSGGKSIKKIDQTHQQSIDASSPIAGQAASTDTDQQDWHLGGETDCQRETRAIEQTGQYVTALFVGA